MVWAVAILDHDDVLAAASDLHIASGGDVEVAAIDTIVDRVSVELVHRNEASAPGGVYSKNLAKVKFDDGSNPTTISLAGSKYSN